MEQVTSPNRSNGLYKENFDNDSLAGRSDASLRGNVALSNSDSIWTQFRVIKGHAAPFAGTGTTEDGQPESDPFADPFARTTPAGIPINALTNPTEADETPQQDEKPAIVDATLPATPPKPPLYKRRWFIITSIIGAWLVFHLVEEFHQLRLDL
jgi:hypothetical protein